MKQIKPAPEAGWGVLQPDQEISDETLKLLRQLDKLPIGQRDAVLAQASTYYLKAIMGIEGEPSATNISDATQILTNIFYDMVIISRS